MRSSSNTALQFFVLSATTVLLSGCFGSLIPGWEEYKVKTVEMVSNTHIVAYNQSVNPTRPGLDFLPVVMDTRQKKSCWKLKRGAFLASCLVHCNGKDAILLDSEPTAESIWNDAQSMYFLDTKAPQKRSFTVREDLSVWINLKIGSARPMMPSEELMKKSKQYCFSDFDADACILSTAETILKNPDTILSQYDRMLYLLQNPNSPASISQQITDVQSLLHRFMELAAKSEEVVNTLQIYTMVAQNIQSSPALLCQSQSLSQNLPGSWQAIEKTLANNQWELKRAILFLEKLGQPQESWEEL